MEELRSIVSKTISFLKLMSMPSCALTTDWKILEIAAARTKLVPKAIVVNSSSFGSESTAS